MPPRGTVWSDGDASIIAAMHRLNARHLEWSATMLRANLNHAFGFKRYFQHLLPFIDIVAGRLFAVDVFASFAGPDGSQCVPVIWRSNRNGVDVFIGEHFAHVRILFGLLAGDLKQ